MTGPAFIVTLAYLGCIILIAWAVLPFLRGQSASARLILAQLNAARAKVIILTETIAEACEEHDRLTEQLADVSATNRALLAWNARLVNEQGELQKPEAPPSIVGEDALAIHDMVVELGAKYRARILSILQDAEKAADATALAITQARERFETVGLDKP